MEAKLSRSQAERGCAFWQRERGTDFDVGDTLPATGESGHAAGEHAQSRRRRYIGASHAVNPVLPPSLLTHG